MKKKTLNLLIILSVIFSFLITVFLIYISINVGESVKSFLKYLEYDVALSISELKIKLFVFIFSIIGTIAAVGITALLIYLLYRINKTELLVAAETTKERVKEYRAERKAAKKEKKKAALQAKLNKLEK